MKRAAISLLVGLGVAIAAAGPTAGCNDVGDCPAATAIVPGGSCSGDNLECPFTLQSPSPACDGTMVQGGVATSCTCTAGTWSCPSPVSCEGGPTGDDGPSGGDASDAAATPDAVDAAGG
jgi:hypothetical protein